MDVIAIEGMRAYARVGVTAAERAEPQAIDASVRCEIDLSAAASSDDLGDSLDYHALHRSIVQAIRDSSDALLERLAGRVLDLTFADQKVLAAEVTLSKPARLDGATASVTLRRERSRA